MERLARIGMLGRCLVGGVLLVISGLIAIVASMVSLSIPISEPPTKTTLPASSDTSPNLRQILSITINNKNYSIIPLPLDELVKGMKGAYYIVDLKSADQQKIWRFKKDEYTVDHFDRDFAQSISAFRQQVIEQLQGDAHYELFVQGSADRDLDNDFRGRLKERYYFTEVTYLPSLNEEQYLFEPKETRSIADPFFNSDLPFLRAAFMQEKLSTGETSLKRPHILDGLIDEKQVNEDLRNAIVFLFIQWSEAKKLEGASP